MKDKHIINFQIFYFLLIGSLGCFFPYINVYLEKSIGLDGSQIGLITAISLVIGVCVVPIWGIIGDKTQKYNIVLMVSLLASIGTLYVYSKQTVYIGVVICAMILEIVRLGSVPMADTISMNYTSQTGGNYGSIRGMGSLGYMLGSMAVGFLADRYGLDGPLFTSYMVLLGLAFLLCLQFPKTSSSEKTEKPQKEHFYSLIKNKKFIFILLLVMMSQICVDSVTAYSGNHLVTTLQRDNSFISWLTFVQVLPEFFFLMVASKVVDKVGYKKYYTFAICLMIIRLLTYAFVPNAYVFVGISIVHCFGVACATVAALAYIKDIVPTTVFGTAITLLNAAMSIAKAIYGYLFGVIYQYYGSYRIFLAGAIIVTIALILVMTTHNFDHIQHHQEA